MHLVKTKAKGKVYLYLKESIWDPDKQQPKKRTVQSFGLLEVLEKNEPEKLAELERTYGYGKKENTELARQKALDDLTATAAETTKTQGHALMLNLSHLILNRIWQGILDLPTLFYSLARKDEPPFDPSQIAAFYSMQQIVDPVSKLNGHMQSVSYLGDPLDGVPLDHVYRCLDFLYTHKDRIMGHISCRVDTMFPRDKHLVFFDNTNAYCESMFSDEEWFRMRAYRRGREVLLKLLPELSDQDHETLNYYIDNTPQLKELVDREIKNAGTPLRMRGHSKEKRTDLPLVSLGLVIDEHGIPIDFMVNPGNSSEQVTMKAQIKALMEVYNLKHAVFVADNGLNSAKNLSLLEHCGFGYSVAQSPLTLSREFQKQHLAGVKDFKPMLDEAGHQIRDLCYKIVPFERRVLVRDEDGESSHMEQIKCQLMLTFSRERKERDMHLCSEFELRVQSGMTEEVTRDGITIRHLKFSQDVVDNHRRCAGFAGVIFKAPPGYEGDLSPEYLSSLYPRLVKIEECFRIMKHDLKLRPMYVRVQEHIKGHVMTCIIALILLRILQRKCAECGISMTIDEIRETLRSSAVAVTGSKLGYLATSMSKPVYRRYTTKSGEEFMPDGTDQLMKALGAEPLPMQIALKDLRRHFKVRSTRLSLRQEQYYNTMRDVG